MAALDRGPHEVDAGRMRLRGVDGQEVDAIHARPLGMPTRGVVLHPDIMGLRPLFDDLCHRLATHGFAVCAPEPFARLDDRESLAAAERMQHVGQLVDEIQIGDLERAADFLVVEDDVNVVAIMGFCMGGMYALKAAATGRFDRAVDFYGMITVPGGWVGPDLAEPLAMVSEMCPTLAIMGSADPFTPAADIAALRAAWQTRSDCEIVVYDDAEHGFVHDPDRPAHRSDDAADAWARVLQFLA